jgi:hypothetical protein
MTTKQQLIIDILDYLLAERYSIPDQVHLELGLRKMNTRQLTALRNIVKTEG